MATDQKEFQRELAEVAPAYRDTDPEDDLTTWNINYGFLDGFLRGKSSLSLSLLLL